MSLREITCLCENIFKAEIPTEYDCQAEPQTISCILDGSFLNVNCPLCKKRLKLEFNVHIFDHAKGWDIELIPELERNEYLRKLTNIDQHNKKRVVIGYRELLEKVKCLQDNLDDQAVEYLKYHILSQIMAKTDNEEIDIRIFYFETKEGELHFHIEGLKQDEIALLKLPQSIYQKAIKDWPQHIQEEPFKDFLYPPYVSINRLYAWQD